MGIIVYINEQIMNNLYGMGMSFYGFELSGKHRDIALDLICIYHQVDLVFLIHLV